MMVLLVLAVWLLLAVGVAALFCALVRGGRTPSVEVQAPARVEVPAQRAQQDERTPTAAR